MVRFESRIEYEREYARQEGIDEGRKDILFDMYKKYMYNPNILVKCYDDFIERSSLTGSSKDVLDYVYQLFITDDKCVGGQCD